MQTRTCAVALAVALLSTPVGLHAESRSRVGWLLDPAYVEIEADGSHAGYRRSFILKVDSPDAWTERIRIDRFDNEERLSAAAWADRLAAEYRESCPLLNDHRIELREALHDDVEVALWHCPEHVPSGRGEVRSYKVLTHQGAVHVLVAEGRYPPFELGATPLLRVQLDRWVRMQQSFRPCEGYAYPGCLPEANAMVEAVPAVMSQEEAAAVAQVEARAHAIFVQDQLAWHATDFALENKLIRGKRRGHFLAIADSEGGGSVYFIPAHRFGRPKGHRVDVSSQGEFVVAGRNVKLEGEVAARYKALRAAFEHEDLKLCSPNANSAVLANEGGDGWIVYILSASTESGKAFIGGHNRIEVGADGSMGAAEHSARSCIGIDATATSPQGDRIDYQVVSHIVSDMPWETHVFQAMTLGVQMFVPTDHAVWRIEGGRLWRLAID